MGGWPEINVNIQYGDSDRFRDKLTPNDYEMNDGYIRDFEALQMVYNYEPLLEEYLKETRSSTDSQYYKEIILGKASELSREDYMDFRDKLSEYAKTQQNRDDKLQILELVSAMYNNINTCDLERRGDRNKRGRHKHGRIKHRRYEER